MARMVEAIAQWARRTSSSFADLRPAAFAATEVQVDTPSTELIYRLRHWPTLPAALRTADVLRLLSLMSNRPVNRSWMLNHSRLPTHRIDQLLARLARQDALDVIDPTRFGSEPAVNQSRFGAPETR